HRNGAGGSDRRAVGRQQRRLAAQGATRQGAGEKVMTLLRSLRVGALVASLLAPPALAADYPTPKQGEWVARDFRFHTGEVVPELRLHYTTIGEPTGQPVLILHGTGGAGGNFLTPAFAGELFGVGQPLDATRYFIILPDAIGAGQSTKPSDGLRAKFPRYT